MGCRVESCPGGRGRWVPAYRVDGGPLEGLALFLHVQRMPAAATRRLPLRLVREADGRVLATFPAPVAVPPGGGEEG